MTDLRKLQNAMNNHDPAGCYEAIRDLFEPARAEAAQVEAEALRILPVEEDDDPLCWSCGEPESEHSGHGSYCPDDRQTKFTRDPVPREPEEFTQQDHDEYNAWLDEIYAAEQLEREAEEADERRNDL